jgi:death-on-curing protein
MRLLTLIEAKTAYRHAIGYTGHTLPIRDLNGLHYALNAPDLHFGGHDLYPTIHSKAAVVCYKIVAGHVFSDGCKRGGNAILLLYLDVNGYALDATAHDQEQIIKAVAEGLVTQEQLADWLQTRIVEK